MKIATAIENAYHKANKTSAEDLYKVIYSYKSLKVLPSNVIDAIYDHIAFRMGYLRNMEKESEDLLFSLGYIE